MEWGWVPIVVALIAGPVMFMLHRLDRRNSDQHGKSMEVLQGIAADVVEVKADVAELKADHRHLAADHRHLSEQVRRQLDQEEAS
jgi:preprotein translocase subunit YajC